jgi:hypothetical protein
MAFAIGRKPGDAAQPIELGGAKVHTDRPEGATREGSETQGSELDGTRSNFPQLPPSQKPPLQFSPRLSVRAEPSPLRLTRDEQTIGAG